MFIQTTFSLNWGKLVESRELKPQTILINDPSDCFYMYLCSAVHHWISTKAPEVQTSMFDLLYFNEIQRIQKFILKKNVECFMATK